MLLEHKHCGTMIVDLITKTPTKRLMGRGRDSMETLDKGMIHIPRGTMRNGARFHHMTQNSVQFKMYMLLIPGISYLLFPDCS